VDWRDRTIAIALGVVIGVGVVVAFVFFLSEQTVDAPSLSTDRAAVGGRSDQHRNEQPSKRDRSPSNQSPPAAPPPLATVRIVGGAPPSGGPAELHYAHGDPIRLNVVSDATLELELTGYGITRTVLANQPTEIDVEASRAGTFGLIVGDSHIDVAQITVAAGSP
jgi:hypothetical protein